MDGISGTPGADDSDGMRGGSGDGGLSGIGAALDGSMRFGSRIGSAGFSAVRTVAGAAVASDCTYDAGVDVPVFDDGYVVAMPPVVAGGRVADSAGVVVVVVPRDAIDGVVVVVAGRFDAIPGMIALPDEPQLLHDWQPGSPIPATSRPKPTHAVVLRTRSPPCERPPGPSEPGPVSFPTELTQSGEGHSDWDSPVQVQLAYGIFNTHAVPLPFAVTMLLPSGAMAMQ